MCTHVRPTPKDKLLCRLVVRHLRSEATPHRRLLRCGGGIWPEAGFDDDDDESKFLIARSDSWKQSRATASSQLSDGDAMASGPAQSPETLITITITITTIVVLVAVVVENEKKRQIM